MSRSDPERRSPREDIDQETGEITPRDGSAPANDEAQTQSSSSLQQHTVRGERAYPSVNRERSLQSRISGALALGTFLLLGAGFLVWYYSTQIAHTREAQELARKAAAARAGGEMKVPPLGRIDPPQLAVAATPVSAGPPLPVATTPAAAPAAGPPQKTPEQLELERQLGQPVIRKAQLGQGSAAGVPGEVNPFAQFQPPPPPPGLAQLLAGMSPQASTPQVSSLASNLKPTATPAVLAQLLPTRRFLLPKGAFVDCTLETAVDSTYEGMTTCIGASDIYGADGKVVLLERGTKYVGEQRGQLRQGQGRVFVLWNEARTPTGVVVQLASPGTDELGRNGLPGFVDTHFWQRFGAAILISVIDGTMQAIAASQRNNGGTNSGGGGAVVLSPPGSRDAITEVLRNTVAIPPTVIKNQGERIQILVARDVDFRPVYALRSNANP
jgi:type IV secretion system protein VirB10